LNTQKPAEGKEKKKKRKQVAESFLLSLSLKTPDLFVALLNASTLGVPFIFEFLFLQIWTLKI
jgi:hypothetical protein